MEVGSGEEKTQFLESLNLREEIVMVPVTKSEGEPT
jgi:hypothetical protein